MNLGTSQQPSQGEAAPRRRLWPPLLVAVAVVFLLHFGLGFQFHGPWYEPDGSNYALRGYHLARGDGLSWRSHWRAPGKEGYPALLAGAWLLAGEDTDLFLRLALVQNAALSALLVAVGYAVLRRWFPAWPSLTGAAAMALYAPVFLYGFALMSENLFFPAFLCAVWAVQRAVDSGRLRWWALAGLAVAVSFSARITGAAFVAALAIVALVEVIRHRRSLSFGKLAAPLVAVAVVVAVLIPLHHLTRPEPEQLVEIGAPADEAGPATEVAGEAGPPGYRLLLSQALRFWTTAEGLKSLGFRILWEGYYILMAGFFLLPVAFVWLVVGRIRCRTDGGPTHLDPVTLFIVLSLVFTLAGVIYQIGASTRITLESMYGRYIDVVVMVLVGFGVAWIGAGTLEAVAEPGKDRGRRSRGRRAGAASTLGRLAPRGAWVFGLAVVATLPVALAVPKFSVIFTGNLGVYYAAAIGSKLAGWLDFQQGSGAGLILLVVFVVLVGLYVLAVRNPRAVAPVLLGVLVINTGLAYGHLLGFRRALRPYREFARSAVPVLRDHFAAHPELPRAVLVGDPPRPEETRIDRPTLARTLGRCSLELYNRDVQFQAFTGVRQVPRGTVMYSLRNEPGRVIHRQGPLRLYALGLPPAPG